MMEEDELQRIEGARACFALASRIVYCEPAEDDLRQWAAADTFRSAPFGMENAEVRKGLALIRAFLAERICPFDSTGFVADGATDDSNGQQLAVASLQREWLRLFIGVGAPEAPCWESWYVDPNSQMFSRATLAVRAWYRRYGLRIENERHEPDDHVGLMLGFVGHLVDCELDALARGHVARAQTCAQAQEEFLREHVLPWLPVWHYLVQQKASSDYYRGAGSFVFGLCACYVERFSIRYDEGERRFVKSR